MRVWRSRFFWKAGHSSLQACRTSATLTSKLSPYGNPLAFTVRLPSPRFCSNESSSPLSIHRTERTSSWIPVNFLERPPPRCTVTPAFPSIGRSKQKRYFFPSLPLRPKSSASPQTASGRLQLPSNQKPSISPYFVQRTSTDFRR